MAGKEGPGSISNIRLAVWVVLAAVSMLFVGFTSTLLVRRAEADWVVGPMPLVLWGTTLLILAASATVEWARSRVRGGDRGGAGRALAVTALLGLLFMAGQWSAWNQLVAQGIHLQTSAHSAFFYLLSGTHAVHVLGGMVGLGYVMVRVRGAEFAAGAVGVTGVFATYWHFMAGLWLYLFALLFLIQ